jgi:putative acetyltransferase
MSEIHVRLAVTADAEAIVRTHHEAVWTTARNHYPPEILEAWAVKLTDESYEQVRQEIGDPEMVVLVAESHAHVAGFGMIVTADEELRAVYVDPAFGRQGVGTAILNRLEEAARERGVAALHLSSSLNAETFYGKHGYEVVERGTHRLRSGHEMACVRMTRRWPFR